MLEDNRDKEEQWKELKKYLHDERKRDKKHQNRRTAAVWVGLSLVTLVNIAGDIQNNRKGNQVLETDQNISQKLTLADKHDRASQIDQADREELAQGVGRLSTIEEMLRNHNDDIQDLDHYNRMIMTVSKRAIEIAHRAQTKVSKDHPNWVAFENAVKDLEKLLANEDKRNRDEKLAERINASLGIAQDCIQRLFGTIHGIASNSRPWERFQNSIVRG